MAIVMRLVVLSIMTVSGSVFLLLVLYHFIRESRAAKKPKRHYIALVFPTSVDGGNRKNRKKVAAIVVLTLLTGTASGQSTPSQGTATEADRLEQKVDLLERQLEEVKASLRRLKETRSGTNAATTEVRPAPAEQSQSESGPQSQTIATQQLPSQAQTIATTEKVSDHTLLPADSTLGVTVDGYYDYNFNHPVGRVNSLRAYDVLSNSFSLNQAAILFELPPDPDRGRRFGTRLDLQFGQATATLQGNQANESRPDIYRNIFQAYGRYIAPVGKGLTLDFGKWASSLGYEGNYTKDQLNYTRSFYFYYLPFYHTGFRANYKVNDKLAVNYWLTNGTQQTEPFNSFKDQMFGVTATPKNSVTWTVNYYLGQEHPDVTPSTNCGSAPLQPGLCFAPITNPPNGRLHIFDSYLSWQVNPKLLFGVEGDYVIQRQWQNAAPGESSAPSHVDGGAAYVQYQFTPHASFAARTEYLSDRGGLFSGTTQALKETTGTFKYTLGNGFIGMMEYRRDWSNQLFFPRGTAGAFVNHQDTATLGLVWWYGGKEGAW